MTLNCREYNFYYRRLILLSMYKRYFFFYYLCMVLHKTILKAFISVAYILPLHYLTCMLNNTKHYKLKVMLRYLPNQVCSLSHLSHRPYIMNRFPHFIPPFGQVGSTQEYLLAINRYQYPYLNVYLS